MRYFLIHSRNRAGEIMAVLDGVKTKASTSGELLRFFMKNKIWWLMPMIVILLVFGVLIVVAESSALGPLIYSLF
jgi:hypothetical protein